MTCKRLLISFYLFMIFHQIASLEPSLQCWRCEITLQSSEQTGVFLDDCQAQFDFTQHTRTDCDGKCWKSVDLIDTQQLGNSTGNLSSLSLIKYALLSKLKSSRRCFSANELVRASEMGVNTSDGCRQVKRDNRKMREVCFCSDQDMCNNAFNLTKNHLFILFIFMFVVYGNK